MPMHPKPRGLKPTGKTPMRAIRVSSREWAIWQARAKEARLTLSEWLREVANRAANSAT